VVAEVSRITAMVCCKLEISGAYKIANRPQDRRRVPARPHAGSSFVNELRCVA
jgi:hypothetical protein